MFQSLLVALDGSALAEQALPVAGSIAHRAGVPVHLTSVAQPVPALLASADEPVPEPGLEQELREQLTEYLKATAEALETTHGAEVAYSVLEGFPAQALADHARARHIGLIVMTTHGHSGINRLWLGSVADRLLRRTRVPVLLLRPSDSAPPTEFRHILVALDGLPEGEQVLEPALELGSFWPECRFTLMQVVEPPVALITRMAMYPARMRPHWRELQENSARSYVERIAGQLRARGRSVRAEVISARGPGEQILRCGQSVGADLIVVGTHGARGVERMLVGSVADKVIRGATQPVLVVPTARPE